MNSATDLALAPIFVADDHDDNSVPDSVPASPMTPPERSRRYCFLLLILPLLAIPAGIRLGASDFFLRHGASVWVQSNDAVFQMRGRECDVLVFGDSTAMTGINPDVVERNTGFKTCNISVTNSVLAVTHNLTLNRYLAHNARPRVLLIQLSPDGFEPESNSWRQTVYPEGLLELLRHGSPAEIRQVLLTHPQESIAFAGYALGFTAYSGVKELWFHADDPEWLFHAAGAAQHRLRTRRHLLQSPGRRRLSAVSGEGVSATVCGAFWHCAGQCGADPFLRPEPRRLQLAVEWGDQQLADAAADRPVQRSAALHRGGVGHCVASGSAGAECGGAAQSTDL
jgi:hypothetical protein